MRLWMTISTLATSMAAAGCLGLGSGTPPIRNFVLTSPIQEAAKEAGSGAARSIGVAPVTIPRYIDRPQIVTTADGNEVFFAELDRWAEPIADGIARALAEGLEALLPGARVDRYPWSAQLAPEVEVRVEILRFTGAPGGRAEVEAAWSLRRQKQDGPSRVTKRAVASGADGYGALVGAWSRLIGDLSREIAAEIAKQP